MPTNASATGLQGRAFSQLRSRIRCAPTRSNQAIAAAVTSIASKWTMTAARPSNREPLAVISRAGEPDMHSGSKAGTSISPAPCEVAIIAEVSAVDSANPGCGAWR